MEGLYHDFGYGVSFWGIKNQVDVSAGNVLETIGQNSDFQVQCLIKKKSYSYSSAFFKNRIRRTTFIKVQVF